MRSRSSELTGGEGYTYEDTVVAYYLTALLHADEVPGIEGSTTKVAVQQAAQGEPLDDLIVDAEVFGEPRRLSLQVKRSLTISEKNAKFCEIIDQAKRTRSKEDFRVSTDKYGFIAGSASKQKLNQLRRIIELAKASGTGVEFDARFRDGGEASLGVRALREKLKALVGLAGIDEEADFYRHFVALHIDGLEHDQENYVEMVNRLAQLTSDGAVGGRTLAELLCRQVRTGQGDAKHWRRPSLLAELRTLIPLRVAPAFAPDIGMLSELARSYSFDIQSDIDGVCLSRGGITETAANAAKKFRFTNIRGLPGVGKSVVLKQMVEAALQDGPVLFLKSNRLEHSSWVSYATGIGLAAKSSLELMAQIGAAGTPILFIDGIDRIEPHHRGIVRDLLHTIEHEPSLEHWRVVATSRDQGLEAYRQWVPVSFYRSTGIGDVPVTGLSDAEANELADQKPTLKRLLFGTGAVREIARRPFFASVLAKRFHLGDDDQSLPTSELELIDAWWRAGGYNAAPAEVLPRQRAMIDSAEVGAPDLGRQIPLRRLKAETVSTLNDLLQDGVLQTVEEGSICSFAHDIYFEWSFYKLLIDAGDKWVDALKIAGEPPLLARIVGLYSQQVFLQRDDWAQKFRRLSGHEVRSQWRRAWLLGPTDSAEFSNRVEIFEALLFSDKFKLLDRFLTWFQAERTIPSPVVLNTPPTTLDSGALIRAADYLGWPSDFDSWQWVLTWIFECADRLPVFVLPSAVELFSVWQNMLADHKNPLSEMIIAYTDKWLRELTTERPERSTTSWRWNELGRDAVGPFIRSLRQLILRSGRAYPESACRLVQMALADEHRSEDLFQELAGFTPILAEICPDAIAKLTWLEVIAELPKDEIERERREREEYYLRLEAIRAKPEAERTQSERRVASSPPFIGGSKSYEFNEIGIRRHHRAFFPATPLNQPFAALFEKAPLQALALVRDMSNRAVTGWHQIHDINAPRFGTPLSIEADFPWGRQTFWGDDNTYVRFLGVSAPHVLESAYLALTYWAHRSIDAGRSVDEVIKEVVLGHESWTVLGLAVSLALERLHASETVLAILRLQRIWRVDLARQVQDPLGWYVSSGLDPRDRMSQAEREAMSFLQNRKFRRRSIRDLAPIFALSADQQLSDKARDALADFPNSLPFAYVEEQTNSEHEKMLREQAQIWASWGDRSNYKTEPAPEVENASRVTFEAPVQPSAETQASLRESQLGLADTQVLHWAMKSLERGTPDPTLDVDAAFSHAKSRYEDDIFAVITEPGDGTTQSCVSATAAVATCFVEEQQGWGWEVLSRVNALRESRKRTYYSSNPFHPKNFLISALYYDLKSKGPRADSASRLLALGIDDNPEISKTALAASIRLHLYRSDLAWVGASMATKLFHWHPPYYSDDGTCQDDTHRAHQNSTLKKALRALATESRPDLMAPPPAWVYEPTREQSRWRGSPDTPVWRHPDVDFDTHFALGLTPEFPVEHWLQSEIYRDPFLVYLRALVTWTRDRTFPQWKEESQDHGNTDLYEWYDCLAHLCIRTSVHMATEETIRQLIAPIANCDDEDGLNFAADLASATTLRRIFDAPKVSEDAVSILLVCLDRLLREQCFDPDSYRPGEIYGFAMPQMIRALLFVNVTDAPGAKRFANGDWSDLDNVMLVVDKLMLAAGWAPFVMETYLTLCELAGSALPVQAFTRHVSPHFKGEARHLSSWRETTIIPRIAGVIQSLADENYPLEHHHAEALLVLLDHLVDLGDRRAAALQQSPQFRNVQVQRS